MSGSIIVASLAKGDGSVFDWMLNGIMPISEISAHHICYIICGVLSIKVICKFLCLFYYFVYGCGKKEAYKKAKTSCKVVDIAANINT